MTLLAVFVCCITAGAADKPNVVYILADDLGIGDLGCYGQEKIRTPNIDRIAAEGMRFTQHYSGNSVCELGFDDNTLVFFSSDNGAVFPLSGTDPEFFKSTGGLRGYKQDLYEGGIRAPLVARWPGPIKAGSVSDHVSAFWDFLPTMAELVGVTAPQGIDGLSFLPTLLGQVGQKKHDFLYWEYHSQGGRVAVRMGDWKGVRNGVKKNANALLELYNLASDAAEAHDVVAAHPDIAAKVREIMTREHTPSHIPAWNF